MGTGTISRHDVRCTDQERPTSNVQPEKCISGSDLCKISRKIGVSTTKLLTKSFILPPVNQAAEAVRSVWPLPGKPLADDGPAANAAGSGQSGR